MTPQRLPMHRGGWGTPLLLLHGITVTWRAWRPILPALEAAHEVIAPTLAGHHGAATLAEDQPPNVRSLADVLESQLDDLGIDAPHIAGNSLGGWVGLELARRGRARSVVGLSPAGAARNARDLRRLHRLVRLTRRLMVLAGPRTQNMLRRRRFRRVVMRFGFERADRFPAAEIAGLFEDIAACRIFEVLTGAIEEEGMIERAGLAEIACPVRIAWGVKDHVIPFARYGRPLLEMIPHAEYVPLPGCGHGCMVDDPELVVQTILEVTRAVDAGEHGGIATCAHR